VIVQTDFHDRLELPTSAPMSTRSHLEKVLDLQRAYDPVLKRIPFMARNDLTSMMVLFDFLSWRIAPLQRTLGISSRWHHHRRSGGRLPPRGSCGGRHSHGDDTCVRPAGLTRLRTRSSLLPILLFTAGGTREFCNGSNVHHRGET
jgi:hypothetical protein